ncbi:hypothetical protein [Amycolatopsis balhimycina]|nr:hypothetical protein [Amycolatopsis balhimycina]
MTRTTSSRGDRDDDLVEAGSDPRAHPDRARAVLIVSSPLRQPRAASTMLNRIGAPLGVESAVMTTVLGAPGADTATVGVAAWTLRTAAAPMYGSVCSAPLALTKNSGAPGLVSRSPRTCTGEANAARHVFVGCSSERRFWVTLKSAGSALAGAGLEVFATNGRMLIPARPTVTWSSPIISPPPRRVDPPAAVTFDGSLGEVGNG